MGSPVVNMKENWAQQGALENGPVGTHWHFSQDLDPRVKLMHEAAAQILQEALEKPNLTSAQRVGVQALLNTDTTIGHGQSNWSVPFANSQQHWIAYPTQEAAKGHNSDRGYVNEVTLPLILSELAHMQHGTRNLLADASLRPSPSKFDVDWISHGYDKGLGIQSNLQHTQGVDWVAQNKKDVQTYGHYDYDYEYLNVWRANALAKAVIGPQAEVQQTYTGLPHGPDSLDDILTARYSQLVKEKGLAHSGIDSSTRSGVDPNKFDVTAPIKEYLTTATHVLPAQKEQLFAMLDQNAVLHEENQSRNYSIKA
jgi:hypothetical protein